MGKLLEKRMCSQKREGLTFGRDLGLVEVVEVIEGNGVGDG